MPHFRRETASGWRVWIVLGEGQTGLKKSALTACRTFSGRLQTSSDSLSEVTNSTVRFTAVHMCAGVLAPLPSSNKFAVAHLPHPNTDPARPSIALAKQQCYIQLCHILGRALSAGSLQRTKGASQHRCVQDTVHQKPIRLTRVYRVAPLW
jgi:hypothetical protein